MLENASGSSPPTASFPGAETPLVSIVRETIPDSGGTIWTLELHNGPNNLLTHEVINHALKSALHTVEQEWRLKWRKFNLQKRYQKRTSGHEPDSNGHGALIITGQGKYFCGGLDFNKAIADTSFFSVTLNPLLVKLLTFPIPVIAAINGHSFTAGVMLALSCDYRVMTDGQDRSAWTCMTEVHLGAPWPDSFVAIATAKVASPHALRTLALDGARLTPQEALKLGIVDKLVPANGILDAAREIATRIAGNAQAGAWGLIKKRLYRDAVEKIAIDYRLVMAEDDDAAQARL